jgi:glutathione S-transferase
MRLYFTPGTISIVVAIALEEAGLSVEETAINFKNGEQNSAAFLKLNPKGRVPAFETDTGDILTEAGAILEYVASLAPHAELVPDDPIKAAQMRSVMYYLASTLHVNHAHKMRGHRWADNPDSFADMTAKVPQTMTESAAHFAEHCLQGDYVLGNAFSLADPYAFVVCGWMQGDGVKMDDFPTIQAFLDRMRARPSVQSVTAKGMLPS